MISRRHWPTGVASDHILIISILFDFPPETSNIWGRDDARLAVSTMSGQILINLQLNSQICMWVHTLLRQKKVSFDSLRANCSALFLRIEPSPLRTIHLGSSLARAVSHSISVVRLLK